MNMDGVKIPAMPDWIRKHVDEYLASDGREGHIWKAMNMSLPTLLLVTKGRASGQKWLVPLIYGKHPKGVVVIASKGGAPKHPGWYQNLVANPDVDVQVGTEKFRARASTVTGPERGKLWNELVEIYPPYVEYQKSTEREIPVVLLERIG